MNNVFHVPPEGTEILAPAGGPEQLAAAVRSGADAVYLGLKSQSARAGAVNFSEEELYDAAAYCRVRGVKVYVTLNTLLKNSELDAAKENIRVCARAGADGVLIQDPGMIPLLREICPDMPVHASTQMTVHNVAGAKACERLGFKRIVLARDLSLDEIRAIAAAVTCEIEAFVHGAQCMSISGACLMSSMLGGRSGNRGRCAQPCRLDFRSPEGAGYALSLKDMSNLPHMREMAEAGVKSFKIEGRLKRPEYVAAAVSAAVHALRGEPYDADTLEKVFSRGGFTDGFITGRRDLSMFGVRTAEDAAESEKVFKSLHALYKNEYKRVPVGAEFRADAVGSVTAVFDDGENSVTVSRRAGSADGVSGQEDRIRAALAKSGGTPYIVSVGSVTVPPGFNMPVSELNALRREGLDGLTAARGRARPWRVNADVKTDNAAPRVKNAPSGPEFIPRYETASQASGSGRVIFPVGEILRHHGELKEFDIIAELPRFVFPGKEAELDEALARLGGLGVRHVVADGIGEFYRARDLGFSVTAGMGMNLLNHKAVGFIAGEGACSAILSPEINAADIPAVCGNVPVGIIAYGYLPLMNYRVCPVKGKRGCKDCGGTRRLTDRTGARFSVLCRDRQYQQLLNSVPLYVCDAPVPGADFEILYFTSETRGECAQIISLARSGAPFPGKRTNGLYRRTLL